jgi:MATE family multidrug resistance protein
MLLTMLSTNLMFMVDRFMLAGYSISAMNASAISGNFVYIFTYMLIGIASSAEIYVGQYNGAGQYDRLAVPVWQMFYMSLLSVFFLIPLGYFSDYVHTLPSYCLEEGIAYQRPLLYFGFLPSTIAAISAFFIGQGRSKIVTAVVLFGTLLNILLDYLLIYGCGHIIPRMGCFGAAFATIITELVQIVILLTVFFSKNNRITYDTWENRKFNGEIFSKCLKVGAPISAGHVVAFISWHIVQVVVSHVSAEQATIYNIGLNIYVFFLFVGEGLNRSIAAITANMIGQKDLKSIMETYKFFIFISLVMSGIVSIPLIVFPDMILNHITLWKNELAYLYDELKYMLYFVVGDSTLETTMLVIWGVLTAGGDTKYPAIVSQLFYWTLVLVPTFIFNELNKLTGVTIYEFTMVWLIICLVLFRRRFLSLKWYNRIV